MMNSHELKIKAPMLLLTSGPTKHPKNKNQNPSKTTWKHTDTLQTIQPHLEKILDRIEPRFINVYKNSRGILRRHNFLDRPNGNGNHH